jgi:hypothetical protein
MDKIISYIILTCLGFFFGRYLDEIVNFFKAITGKKLLNK